MSPWISMAEMLLFPARLHSIALVFWLSYEMSVAEMFSNTDNKSLHPNTSINRLSNLYKEKIYLLIWLLRMQSYREKYRENFYSLVHFINGQNVDLGRYKAKGLFCVSCISAGIQLPKSLLADFPFTISESLIRSRAARIQTTGK